MSLLLAVLLEPSSGWAGIVRHVHPGPEACGTDAPCYSTIQSAVDAAAPGDTVEIQAGLYPEQLTVSGKNDHVRAGEHDRITIEADPGAEPGSVVVRPPVTACDGGEAVRIRNSSFVTVRGLTITGAGGAAIALETRLRGSVAVHLERNRLVSNGRSGCQGGLVIGRGHRQVLVVNNAIHANGGNGISIADGGGPYYVINNTIHGNGGNGVAVGAIHEVFLVNNAITGNGLDRGGATAGGGIRRDASRAAGSASILLLHNLICGNRPVELRGALLDRADSGNLTPAGGEGPGVSAAPGCADSAATYRDVLGPDERPGTEDDDFTPAPGSALVDRGSDARGLGLDAIPAALLESDLLGAGGRPRAGTAAGREVFDIGAVELAVEADTLAPAVDFLAPPAGALLRGAVAVAAEATDAGSGVKSLDLRADSQPVGAITTPAPPAPAVKATGTWTTSGTPDGAHTLTAIAMDGAGGAGSATRVVITDNTPPTIGIERGPDGTIGGTEATFVLAATDNLTPPDRMRFAWRLDGSAWSPFENRATIVLTGLTPGVHVLEAKAQDAAGNESPLLARRSFTVESVQVAITVPVASAVVESGLLVVRGTVTTGAREVGVLVNGFPAAVDGSSFAALTEIRPDTKEISAVATSATGASARATVRITVVDAGPLSLLLGVTPAFGVAPLEVSFDVGSSNPGAPLEVDLDGDGRVEVTTPALEDQSFTYSRPGIYAPTVTQTDRKGRRRSASAVVLVADGASLDALLQAKWAGMRRALREGDIPRALTFLSSGAREQYGEVFRTISAQLSTIDTVLTDITLDYVGSGFAIYQAARTDDAPMLFEVRFAMGADGLWRIDSF